MPHYDYECQSCGFRFEAFHAMSAQPLTDCPECGQPQLIKLIGMGAAAIVKGTETPCRGSRCNKQRMNPKNKDRLGEGINKGSKPFWRDGPVNKKILDNPKKYIQKGEVD